MNEIDPREARLPKWAQQELALLRGEVTQHAEALLALTKIPDDASTVLVDAPGMSTFALPAGTRVSWCLKDSSVIQAYADRMRQDFVTVRENTWRNMVVKPQSGNVVQIGGSER